MTLNPRTLMPRENETKKSTREEFLKKIKTPKRIVEESESEQDDSSESDSEEDVPLIERKAIKNKHPVKKVKLTNARSLQPFDFSNKATTSMSKPTQSSASSTAAQSIKKPVPILSKPIKERVAQPPKEYKRLSKLVKEPKTSPSSKEFKALAPPLLNKPKIPAPPIKAPVPTKECEATAPVYSRGFKAPVLPKAPAPMVKGFKSPKEMEAPICIPQAFKAAAAASKEFKAPVSPKQFKVPLPVSSNGFKAPGPPSSNNFKAPSPVSSNGFRAPGPVSSSKDQSNEFKVPFPVSSSNDVFKGPETHQSDMNLSRLNHYMTSICQDLDKYDADKTKMQDSLLTFRDNDDLPTLDISVMRKFTVLTATTNKQHKGLPVNMEQFGKVMKLMENSINVSTDIDIIEFYAKDSSDDRREKTLKMFEGISEALDTCSMIFELLTTCDLDKKFLSKNLITNCLHFMKNQLDFTVYPLIDLNTEEDDSTSISSNAKIFLSLIQSSPREKQLMSTFIPHIIRFFRRALTLILAQDLDDDVLVIVAYISMAPFFHDYADIDQNILISKQENDATFNLYEQLKMCSLDILKHIFSRYPKHRRWIFEEILTSLGTLTSMDGHRKFRLRNNESIHIISALFMQLVQCSATLADVTLHKNWSLKWNVKYQKHSSNPDHAKTMNDKLLNRAATAWRQGVETAANCASFFLEFLMSKCKAKKQDAYSVMEYRQILDYTLKDVMTVFNDPDWPVAELIMRVFSRILLSLLEENHSDQFLKSLAIEWLGIIACKIKTGYNRLSGGHKSYTPEWIYDLNETLPIKMDINTPLSAIATLDQCRKRLLDHAIESHANINVIQFYLCNWGFIESVLWTKANKGWEIADKKMKVKPVAEPVEKKDQEGNVNMMETTTNESIDMEIEESRWPKENVLLLEETCKYYWFSCIGVDCKFPKSATAHKFPEMSRSDYLLLTELLASRQTLYTSFHFIMAELLTCLDKDAVVYRTKALRAIGKIAAQVPEIMEDKRIRNSVVQRVHDGSPSVRDAAIEVVAKYLGRLDTVPVPLYQVVSARVMDTAVTVRKRLVKLLGDLYYKFYDFDIKIDIASKLILRIGDNEITISQLALKVTQDILFKPFEEIEKEGNDYFGYSYANSPKDRKKKITDLTKIITGAVSKLDPSIAAQHAALSQIIQKTVDGADEKQTLWYEKVFQWIVDSLFDHMIHLEEEAADDSSTGFINCLATVYSFTKSCANLLREAQISMLQPYLCIASSDDWTKARYVLTIYRDVLPKMRLHDPEFIKTVERILMQLLSKCPLDIIPDGISCLCMVVDRISHRYNILIKMLGSCFNKLRQVRTFITEGNNFNKGAFAGVLKMLMICGLLCQHFEFDRKRQQEPEEMEALNLVYRGEISILVFDLLQFFTGDVMDDLHEEGMSMRMTALQGLGYFFASFPTFMISEPSTALMDKIFDQGSTELKTQLMRVFQEFLAAEEKRIDKRTQEAGESHYTEQVDVSTLLGDTEEYAELGVNGSLMQRYLNKILRCALSESVELRYAAFEVVSAIMHQGLAHPVLCMPVVVAAETSPDIILRNKAYYLHRYAHDKYGSLLYSRMGEYLSTSYDYQEILLGQENVRGYGKHGGDAKLDPILGLAYSVLKDKKKAKMDFLRSLVKPFDYDLKFTAPEDVNTGYHKYLAENMITLDFCNTEEVLTVVYLMDRIFMTLGADLLSYVHFLKKQDIVIPVTSDEYEDTDQELSQDFIVAAKLAISLSTLFYVKNLLVELYDIPDDEIRDFNPNSKKKPRDVTKDMEMESLIDWTQLLYYKKHQKLNKVTASDACHKFEYLIMSDTTAVVIEDKDGDDS